MKTLCYIQYSGILPSKIKEQSRDIYNVCKCQMHFAKWEKSDHKATGTENESVTVADFKG